MVFIGSVRSFFNSLFRVRYLFWAGLMLLSAFAFSRPSVDVSAYDWSNQSPVQKEALDHFYHSLKHQQQLANDHLPQQVVTPPAALQSQPDQSQKMLELIQQLEAPAAQ